MNQKERDQLIIVARKIQTTMGELDELADEILAVVLKKTTQRSPEWSGATNCM